jgi:AmpE protein
MTFIITLISLVIERFFHWNQMRQWKWFLNYQRWLCHSRLGNWPAIVLMLIIVLPAALLVGMINCALDGWFYGIFKILFGIAVLMYCLGPQNLWVQVYACIGELYKEDSKNAFDCINAAFNIEPLENSQTFHEAFTRAIFLAANKRIFAVVFWFVLLGPVGAVLYRSIALMSTEPSTGLSAMALKILHLFDWLPVRLMSFIFALMGHFNQVFIPWKHNALKGPESNDAILTECGLAAINGKHLLEGEVTEKEAISLLDRVFVASLMLLAVIVLIT